MINTTTIVKKIKNSIKETAPNATVILYGSQARGDYRKNSDVDILILLDKEKITREDEKRVKYPLYDIEFEADDLIADTLQTKGFTHSDTVLVTSDEDFYQLLKKADIWNPGGRLITDVTLLEERNCTQWNISLQRPLRVIRQTIFQASPA